MYMYALVQKKFSKISIILKKSKGIMHSVNKANTSNKTWWKIMSWLTKINFYHCKNDQNILLSCCNRFVIERLTQEFDTPFEYNLQKESKLKPLNIDIIQSKYDISVDQTYHIMKNIIQEYWGTKMK